MDTATPAPPRLLRLPTVIERCGIGRSLIYRKIAEGTFPKPIRLGGRAVAWPEAEVTGWIVRRIAEARGEADAAPSPLEGK